MMVKQEGYTNVRILFCLFGKAAVFLFLGVHMTATFDQVRLSHLFLLQHYIVHVIN